MFSSIEDALIDSIDTDSKQLKLWAEFSKRSDIYGEVSKRAKELLNLDKKLLLSLKPKIIKEINKIIRIEHYY